jgi:hypothetical protein
MTKIDETLEIIKKLQAIPDTGGLRTLSISWGMAKSSDHAEDYIEIPSIHVEFFAKP